MVAAHISDPATTRGHSGEQRIMEAIQTTEEEVARANIDAVFEFACRFIVMKSLPAWVDEICTEHLRSANALPDVTKLGDRTILAAES